MAGVMIMIGSAGQAYRWGSGLPGSLVLGLRGPGGWVPEMVRWPVGWLGTYPGHSGNVAGTASTRDGQREVMDLFEWSMVNPTFHDNLTLY